MTNCIAITRDGRGDLWAFGSAKEADLHPLIQYGDPIIEGHKCLTKMVPIGKIPRLMSRLGSVEMSERAANLLSDTSGLPHHVRVLRFNEVSHHFWNVMVSCAKAAPEDPTTVINLIRRDRKLSIEESKMNDVTTEAPTTEAPTTEAPKQAKKEKAPKEPKEPKEPKAAAEPKTPKYPLTSTIKMMVDENGKVYGKENNPKRPGSASHDRFAHYVDGMTVEEALKGVKTADLDWDINKGYIQIVG